MAPITIPAADLQFQSTYPHGVRLGYSEDDVSLYLFQSTYPHGVRRYLRNRCPQLSHFNPRTRTGYDNYFLFNFIIFYNFNPRTRTGYDQHKLYTCMLSLIFQSTYPHGVRPANYLITCIVEQTDNYFLNTQPGSIFWISHKIFRMFCLFSIPIIHDKFGRARKSVK